MKHIYRVWAGLLCAACLSAVCSGCGMEAQSNTEGPLQITVWTYYNGEQLESFNALVKTFNETTGREQNILVETYSQGSVDDLERSVMDAALGKVGSDPLPNLFSAYADSAYALDEMGLLVDLSPYFTQEERAAYVDAYLTEGDFSQDGSIKIFPVAKSTELLFLNDTDWQVFAEATGADYADLATMEGLLETAERYYDWTDAQTPTPDDGKALFGRDAMANYLLVGAKELGCTVFDVDTDRKMTLHFDQDVMRTLWDYYYVPYLRGRFCATGRFRSDDIKTGNLLAYVGSSSSATFFPERVVASDTESHEITLKALPAPHFQGQTPVSAQQGAGMAVTAGDEEVTAACVTFLKWFTEPEHDIAFSALSGFLPVTKEANQLEVILANSPELDPHMEESLHAALEVVQESTLYTSGAFSMGQEARSILDYALSDQATADRAMVEERMAQGQSLEQAAADFLTEEHFEAWYQETLARLQACEG